MEKETRRITLISHDPRTPDRDWDVSPMSPNKIVILDSLSVLRSAIGSGLVDMDLDVDRIVLDRTVTPAEFLAFLGDLSPDFGGDVLLIRDDETGFLTTYGRQDERVLHALSSSDLRFYLEMNSVVSGRLVARRSRRPQQTVPTRVIAAA